MDKSTLKLYYVYFIPITLLQSITSILLINYLSIEDYGTFTLYLSSINFFFFLTFGLQNGYTIAIKENILEENSTFRFLKTTTITLSFILLLSLPIVFLIPIETYWKLAYVCGIFNAIFIIHKAIHRVNLSIHHLNILILAFRLIFLFDIVSYIVTSDITITLLFDVFCRFILVSISSIILFWKYKSIDNNISALNYYPKLFKLGLPIMVGNWLISMYTILDKFFLSNRPNDLGLYSFAITSVLLVRVIIIPLSELYFVSLNKNETNETYYNKLNTVFNFSLLIIPGLAIAAIVGMNYIGIFIKYNDALPLVLILLNIIPISLSLDLHIYNFIRRLSGKLFLILAGFSALITYSILYVYVTFADFSLINYCYLVYVSYLVVFIIFNLGKLDIKNIAKLVLKYLFFLIVYTLLILLVI